jgi:hypothetical protein
VLLALRVRDDQLLPGDHVSIELGPGVKVHLDIGQEARLPGGVALRRRPLGALWPRL